MVYLFADVSGANLNPAVSWGLCLGKRITLLRCALYTVAQCIGAMIGVGFACSMSAAKFNETNGGANVVNELVGAHQAFGGEILCTWILVTVVLCATNPRLQQKYNHQVRSKLSQSQSPVGVTSAAEVNWSGDGWNICSCR